MAPFLPHFARQAARLSAAEWCRTPFALRCHRTSSSVVAKPGSYIDEWFASIVKPKSFYDHHARSRDANSVEPKSNTGVSNRCYFYNVDLQGRLFLEETLPKNIATSIKDDRFLDFFFSRIRRTSDRQQDWMRENDIPVEDYPFVSACGKELNFIRPAATPIVFHSLVSRDGNGADDAKLDLVFGGKSMIQPFDEIEGIAISTETGRMYHMLTARTLSQSDSSRLEYGLIRLTVAVALADQIVADFTAPHTEMGGVGGCSHSGMGFKTGVHDAIVPIPCLPDNSEPGPWAMPSAFDE